MATADVAGGGDGAAMLQRVEAVRRALKTSFLRTQIDAGATAGERVSLILLALASPRTFDDLLRDDVAHAWPTPTAVNSLTPVRAGCAGPLRPVPARRQSRAGDRPRPRLRAARPRCHPSSRPLCCYSAHSLHTSSQARTFPRSRVSSSSSASRAHTSHRTPRRPCFSSPTAGRPTHRAAARISLSCSCRARSRTRCARCTRCASGWLSRSSASARQTWA